MSQHNSEYQSERQSELQSGQQSDLQTRLGLDADPFAPQALPNFFFVGGQRRFLAQRALHALYFSAGIVLLSGARGAGKSRLLEEVVAELRDLADSCRIDATVLMDGVEIRRTIASRLGLAPGVVLDNTSLIAALTHWQPAGREPHPVALIIDDAHLLSIPALAECLQLVRSSGGRLRLLLCGEPDLLAAGEQAGAEAAERIELPPLDRQETADYVATRLQAAGYRAELPLTATQLNDLYRLSGGNFGAIHDWLPSLFATAPQGPRNPLGRLRDALGLRAFKGLPLPHIGIAAGLLLVVVLLVANRGGEPTSTSTAQLAATEGPGDTRRVVLPLPSQQRDGAVENPAGSQPPVATRSAPSAIEPARVERSRIEPAKVEPAGPAPVKPEANKAGAHKVEAARAEVTKSEVTGPEPAKAETPQPAKPQPVPMITAGQKIALPAPQSRPTAAVPAAAPQPQPVAQMSAAPVPAPQATAAQTQQSAQPTQPTQAAVATEPAAAGGDSADERELLGWSNKQFALQLLGAGSAATVTKFRQQASGAKLYTYRTDLNGKPWYIVVTGPYPSRNAATAAADALPPALRNQKPWPRAVKNIQADIRQRK